MALSKNPKFDLKLKFRRITEIGLILALSLIILAFKYFPELQKNDVVIEVVPDDVSILDVPSTVHQKPEVPPKIPIAQVYEASDDILDEPEVDFGLLEMETELKKAPPKIDVNDNEEVSFGFVPVEDEPEIIGGLEAVLRNLEYPPMAKRANIQGTVIIFAYLDEKGNILKVEIAKDINAGCGEAAAKAVSKVKFIPGKQRGKPVRCRVAVPVRFRLN